VTGSGVQPARTDPEAATPITPASGRGLPAPGWLWPAALLVLVPVVVPVLFLAARVAGSARTAGATLVSADTAALLVRSILFTTAVTVTAAAIGVAAAWLTTRTRLPGAGAWSTLIALPLVIPSYVIALAILSFQGPRGLFADLTGIGLPAIHGFAGAWLALTLSTYPYVFLITRAALGRLDPAHEEAARSLGASGWRAFRTVVLPQLRPALAAGSLLVALYTLSDFGAVSLMRFDVFTRVIYAQYQIRLDRTPAAVLSLVLIAIVLVVLWAEQRTRGRAAYASHRPTRPGRRVALRGGQRRAALLFLSGMVTAGVVLPVTVLTIWLGRGLLGGGTIDMRWGAVAGSLTGSLLAALLALVAAVPVVVLTVRHRSRAAAWVERAVYVGFSLPHITVALAVVFFAARYLGGLYQSLPLLVVVYAAIFLAQATGAGRTALLQVSPHLEEAARSLGKGSIATLRQITVPLMGRGLLAGAALVFLTTMKELPATLLLRPTGFDTLAVRVWSAAGEVFYARAAAPALLLVAVSAVPIYFLVIRRREVAP